MDGLSMEDGPRDPPDGLEDDAAKPDEEVDDAELIERAKACYQTGVDATAKWREQALEDLAFLAGDQWDPNISGQRAAQGRPALTVNRLPQFVRQVTNEQRQSKPSVTVSPVDSGSDVKTAEVLQGVIRNIEYTSNADAAYARYTTSPAASSGVPKPSPARSQAGNAVPSRWSASTCGANAGMVAVIAVAATGTTALTVMPARPHSIAHVRTIPTTAALAAE